MTTEDCTFSVRVIRGGAWVDCVATNCTARDISMAKRLSRGRLLAGLIATLTS